jgi:hypothetical protein
MAKNATSWSSNIARNTPVIEYSDVDVTYNDPLVAYSGIDVTEPDIDKNLTAWDKTDKTSSAWSANPASETNLYAYDSGSLVYDSATRTYDGIVTGESFISGRIPTEWSNT